MSLRHSPPQPSPSDRLTNKLTENRSAAITFANLTCDSDTPSERSGSDNVVRTKRRRDHDDIGDLRNEMRELFSKLSVSVDHQFKDVKQQNIELQDSLQFMSDKYDKVLEKIQLLEEERKQDKINLHKLEEKVDALEKKIKSTGLEIRNIPKTKNPETKEEMCNLVKSIAKTVNIDLQDEHIKDIYRTSTKDENLKPIIVELNSTLIKENILLSIRTFNKDKIKGEKLNTNHIKIPGATKPIYVSEALTFKTQRLFYLTRSFAKENGFAYCWTSKGNIYLRRAEGKALIRIESENDLTKINQKI